MRRREFIAGVGGAIAAWPLAARAQGTAKPVIGFLSGASASTRTKNVAAFKQGLQQQGFVEGDNVLIEYRWAEGHYDRLLELAADLVRRKVDVIAATTTPGALAAKAATTTIPVVFEIGGDPMGLGLVASLARPGGNITGATTLNTELVAKCVALLHELIPTAKSIGQLVNPRDALAKGQMRDAQNAARSLDLQLHILNASTPDEIDAAFAAFARTQVEALVVGGGELFVSRTDQLAALAAQYKLPAVFQHREVADAGGLMSYGASITEDYRLAGVYAGRILKGEKPADLPVIQPSKFELVINLKAANALGLTVPREFLFRADEVIE